MVSATARKITREEQDKINKTRQSVRYVLASCLIVFLICYLAYAIHLRKSHPRRSKKVPREKPAEEIYARC